MKIFTPLTLLCFLIQGCTIPKEARILKKTAKEWRKSPIVIHAWADTPYSGIFLTLRANGKFEQTSSGIIQSFNGGTWTNAQDTIRLIYLDSKQNTLKNQNIRIDRQTSTLILEGDSTPVTRRLKIMTNKL